MKKSRILMLIALIVILCLGAFYVYRINIFNHDTIKSIDIKTGDYSNPSEYVLDQADADELFVSLSSLRLTDIDDTTQLKDAVEFELTLLNKWDLTNNYKVYITTDHTVYVKIDNEKSLYQVTDTNFFSHEGFDSLYGDHLFPLINATLNQADIQATLSDASWSFQKLDETWHEISPEIISSTYEKAVLTDSESILSLNCDKQPTEATLKIIDTKTEAVTFDGLVNIGQMPLPEYDGIFSYELTLTWSGDDAGFRGTTTVSIPVDVDMPESFALSKTSLQQGEMLVINASHVNNPSELTLDQDLSNKFEWFVSENGLRGYLPTNYATELGVHTLTFKNTVTGTISTFDIEVVSRSFKVQRFTADPNMQASTQNDEAYAEYRNVFLPSRTVSAPEKYYTEAFLLPTQGRLTTEFGESRVVNDVPVNYRHTGWDIGAPRGEEVLATNAGKVVLATKLILLGNVVVIDHGEGLFSVCQHLDSLNVSKDDMVTRGQLIATVGSTGFSTGPHLHFMISYYDIYLEPGFFIYGEAVTKENYTALMK